MTKVDLRVIPFLCILYLLAFLDRVNVSNANLYGLSTELKLEGNDFNNALVIFFVPYILFEIPSNLLLKKFRPHIWLPACMFFFGLVTICQGLVSSYGGLLTARFFLGVFEAGMFPGTERNNRYQKHHDLIFPGCFYLIGMWYKRSEAQRRYSFFFSSTTLAGAFGGLLAAAIGKMSGVRGYLGWRWVFILEGLLTCVVAITFFFCLPDFPEEASWLSTEERAYIQARLRADQGQSARKRRISAADVGNCFKDFKFWLGAFMYFFHIVPAYAYAYFSPGIIRSYGYSPVGTQLHSVPPWAVAFGFAMLTAFVSDFTKHRFLVAVFAISVALTGFAILTSVHDNTKLEYAALFLCAMGTYSAMPIVVCWFNMNLGGHHRRSVGTAWQVGFGNIGGEPTIRNIRCIYLTMGTGIIAVYAFLAKDAPEYITGYSICLAFLAMAIVSCTLYFLACWWQNRQRDRMLTNLSLTEHEKTEMGDLSPDYRYQL